MTLSTKRLYNFSGFLLTISKKIQNCMTNFKQVVGGTRSQPIKVKEKFIKVFIKLKKNEIKLQKKTKRLLTQHLTIFTALFLFF